MSNFDFLKDYDETLWKLGNRIEEQVKTSPSGVKADATTFLEHILKKLLYQAGLKYNSRKPFTEQVDAVFRSNLKMSNAYRERIKSAYNYRNKIHDEFEEIEKHEYHDALQLHEKLFYIAKKYYLDYIDGYKEVPQYRPLEIDFDDSEVEQIKVPDFNEIIDIKYDYCVICGEPNHLNYSIYCHRCSRVIDNANNFISIRNSYGKDAKFTKEDLIEEGMPEGYINQFINSLVRENMLKVAGRYITFNNMHLDEYLKKIDNYIAVGELITRFREDKITPSDIKKSREYVLGSRRESPFYQFYKVIDQEIVNKFEKDILTTENIWDSMEYTTITQKQLETWYMKNMNAFNKGNVNDSFVVFNDLLKNEYMRLKREGLFESDIKSRLNVSPEIYEFWSKTDECFEDEIMEIKKDLILRALSEGKTSTEAIEIAGVTAREYDDLVKYSDFKGDEFSQMRNREVEIRKKNFIEHLKSNDVETSCELAKISLKDFYKWYEEDLSSEFYMDTTKVLMHNFLNQRRKAKSRAEAAEIVGIDYKYVERWFNRTHDIYENFKNEHVTVLVNLIYQGFKDDMSKVETAKMADTTVNRINNYLKLGQRGYGTYKKLYDYYESEIIPKRLSRLLDEIRHKPLKKALEACEISEGELEYYLNQGLEGNVKYKEFYESYYAMKLDIYLANINKGKDKSKALKNANLTKKELNDCYELGRNGDDRFREFYQKYYNKKLDIYFNDIIKGKNRDAALKHADLSEDELPQDIDEVILDKKLDIVSAAIRNDLTTKQAARKANVRVDDVYGWFLKGRAGDEKFKEFADLYYNNYVILGARFVQRGINEDIPLSFIFKKAKNVFDREDYEFWLENGFLKEAQKKLEEEDDDDETSSIFKDKFNSSKNRKDYIL